MDPGEGDRWEQGEEQHEGEDEVPFQVCEAALHGADEGVCDDGDGDGVDGAADAAVFVVEVEEEGEEGGELVEVEGETDTEAVDVGVADEVVGGGGVVRVLEGGGGEGSKEEDEEGEVVWDFGGV